MTEFTALLAGLRRDDTGHHITVTDDWLQGRTTYGGLAAALCYEAACREFADLPPLRSAQFSFVGPASGPLRIAATTLRRGKSTVFIGVDLFGEAGIATRATLCFAAARQSSLTYSDIVAPSVPGPENSLPFFDKLKQLNFASHFHDKLAGGHPPRSGDKKPEMILWLKHRDPDLQPSTVGLLALADAPPPASMVRFPEFTPISTMTWSIDCLTDAPSTEDGWWLIRTSADSILDGYSSQSMTVWNSAGQPVMIARQNIAIFL